MRNLIVTTLFILLVSTAAAGCVSDEPLPVSVRRNLVFASQIEGSQREWRLDSYAPEEDGEWPAVVFLPSWDETKEMTADLAKAVAEKGAVVQVIDYPRIDNSLATMSNGRGYRQLAELTACAIRFAHSSAADPERREVPLILAGASYGGGIASHVALFGENVDHRWEEYGIIHGGPSRQVECTINEGTTHVDTLVGIAGTYDAFVGYEGEFGRDYIEPRDPDLWAMLYSAIGENPDLKIYLLHSQTDSVVPYNNSANFRTLLKKEGYDVSLDQYEGDHIPTPLEPAIKLIIEALEG